MFTEEYFPMCENCKFWQSDDPDKPDKPFGQCRIYPPSRKGWPKTGRFDWCGQHQESPESEKIRAELDTSSRQ